MSVRLTSQLRAEGIGSSQLRRMVRNQELLRVRRGAFVDDLDDGAKRHVQLIRATLPRLAKGTVISHISAATLHGLPVDAVGLDRVTVTHPGKGGALISRYVHRYRTPLADADIEEVDALPRTVLSRTVIDLARCGELVMGVAAADAALRRGATREQLLIQLSTARRRHGVAQARVVVEFADARSESPGESMSRVVIWRLGLPAPDLQFEITVNGRRYRSDFAWPEHRVLGEFDGKVKYGELLRPGEQAADVVMREKRRDADLQAAGWTVVHWTYTDVLNPDRLLRLLRPQLHRAG